MATLASKIDVTPVTPAVGGIVNDLDISRPLDPEIVQQLRKAWLDRGVLFFPKQELDDQQLEDFIGQFGKPITEPSNASFGADPERPPVHGGDTTGHKRVAERWHADATWLAQPPTATALRMVQPPPAGGGDTLWANATVAYDDLIEPIRDMLDRLRAVHWMAPSLEAMGVDAQDNKTQFTHPVVSVHPETGRKAIFVSEAWTRCIADVMPAQSVHLLAMLYDHMRSPFYNVRWRWSAGDVALWDNRTVQHFAVPDYDGGRIIQRVVTEGWSPRGPYDA